MGLSRLESGFGISAEGKRKVAQDTPVLHAAPHPVPLLFHAAVPLYWYDPGTAWQPIRTEPLLQDPSSLQVQLRRMEASLLSIGVRNLTFIVPAGSRCCHNPDLHVSHARRPGASACGQPNCFQETRGCTFSRMGKEFVESSLVGVRKLCLTQVVRQRRDKTFC